eukprot:gene10452-8407_t
MKSLSGLSSAERGASPKVVEKAPRTHIISRVGPPGARPAPGYYGAPGGGGGGGRGGSGRRPDYLDLSQGPSQGGRGIAPGRGPPGRGGPGRGGPGRGGPGRGPYRGRGDFYGDRPPPGTYDPLFSPGPAQGGPGGAPGPGVALGSRPPLYSRMPMGPTRYRDEMEFEDDEEDERAPSTSNEKRIVNGKPLLVNYEIKPTEVRVIGPAKATEVRVVGPAKEQLGVKDFNEVMMMARAADMDVCLLNGEVDPPLVRIINWSKYKFEVEKSKKQAKSGSAVQETKEIRMRPRTDTNDISIKVKSAMKFLAKGHKIKLTMRFEGRELQFREQGKEVLLDFIQQTSTAAKVEGPLNFKSGTYTIMLAPENNPVALKQ